MASKRRTPGETRTLRSSIGGDADAVPSRRTSSRQSSPGSRTPSAAAIALANSQYPSVVQVNPVVGDRCGPAQSGEVDVEMPSSLGRLPDRAPVERQDLVMPGRDLGGLGTQVRALVGDGRDQDDASPGPGEHVEQAVQPLREPGQAGLAVERVGHAVADEDHRGLQREDVALQVLEAVGRGAEARAGVAVHRVAAPAQVAEADLPLGIAGGQDRLEIAVAGVAFDQRIAHEDDPVAILQLEPRGSGGGSRRVRRSHAETQESQYDAKGALHEVSPGRVPWRGSPFVGASSARRSPAGVRQPPFPPPLYPLASDPVEVPASRRSRSSNPVGSWRPPVRRLIIWAGFRLAGARRSTANSTVEISRPRPPARSAGGP